MNYWESSCDECGRGLPWFVVYTAHIDFVTLKFCSKACYGVYVGWCNMNAEFNRRLLELNEVLR